MNNAANTNTNAVPAARLEALKAAIAKIDVIALETPNKFCENEFGDLGLKTAGCDAKLLRKFYYELLWSLSPVITKAV